jgi:ferredoxin
MIGIDYESMPVLKVAKENNLLSSFSIDGTFPLVSNFKLPEAAGIIFGPGFLHNFLRRHTTPLPVCEDNLCQLCNQCWTICPAQAIQSLEAGVEFDYQKCIRCYCCIEICPHGALHSRETIGGKVMRRLIDKSN